jgi:TPR repeat protein
MNAFRSIAYILLFFIFILSPLTVWAQVKSYPNGLTANEGNQLCEIIENPVEDKQIREFINRITKRVGVQNRFSLVSCSDKNGCHAVYYKGKAYILYNTDFLRGVQMFNFTETSLPKKSDDWEALCILAHEIGHHWNLHFTNNSVGLSNWDIELEADYFAGHMMAQLGATLQQAQQVMERPSVTKEGSKTHPPRKLRLDRIKDGWENAPKPFERTAEDKLSNDIKKELVEAKELYQTGNYGQALAKYKKYKDSPYFTSTYQTDYGLLFFRGQVTNGPNYKEARKWFVKAAGADDDRALLYLGLLYLLDDITIDQKKLYNDSIGIFYLNKSAQLGNSNAMIVLGDAMLQQAADMGNTVAQIFYGQELMDKQTPDQIKLGLSYLKKSKESGNALGYIMLGGRLTKEDDDLNNDKTGYELMIKGAESLLMNKKLFILPDGEKHPSEEAEFAFSALLGHLNKDLNLYVDICTDIFRYYSVEDIGPKDMSKALPWLELCAIYGSGEIAFDTGRLFEEGKSDEITVPVDLNKAKTMYQLALKKNYPKAQEALDRLKTKGVY